jgi:hypothetical protein
MRAGEVIARIQMFVSENAALLNAAAPQQLRWLATILNIVRMVGNVLGDARQHQQVLDEINAGPVAAVPALEEPLIVEELDGENSNREIPNRPARRRERNGGRVN